eukprot:782172-Amphidinium_carterae.2
MQEWSPGHCSSRGVSAWGSKWHHWSLLHWGISCYLSCTEPAEEDVDGLQQADDHVQATDTGCGACLSSGSCSVASWE